METSFLEEINQNSNNHKEGKYPNEKDENDESSLKEKKGFVFSEINQRKLINFPLKVKDHYSLTD